MDSEGRPLHVIFFPLMAYGHMIPTLDIARKFTSRGVKITIATTPLNAPVFTKAAKQTDGGIGVQVYSFPGKEVGLPEGVENLDSLADEEMTNKFLKALNMLEGTLEKFIEELKPNCIVADMFFPWATDLAARFNIPRLVFHGSGFFPFCVWESIKLHRPYKNVSLDDEEFPVPELPHEVRLTRLQVPVTFIEDVETDFAKLLERADEAERKSFGVIMNSFYELEPGYADLYRQVLGRRSWHVGPVSLSNRSVEDKGGRGKQSMIDEDECLKWLDSKDPDSVIYISFGSITKFSVAQLHEIACALEASGQYFIWVVRGCKDETASEDEWFPGNFEKRVEERGRIIRGWAPQLLILDHRATGGFVTHCGWNSTLEGISSGVPMVAWPVFAEQNLNSKFITDILKIGVPVGAKKYNQIWEESDIVKKEAIEDAVRRVMVGEEAAGIRSRATELKELARKAVEEGGSSDSDMSDLLHELRYYQAA